MEILWILIGRIIGRIAVDSIVEGGSNLECYPLLPTVRPLLPVFLFLFFTLFFSIFFYCFLTPSVEHSGHSNSDPTLRTAHSTAWRWQ